MKRHDTTLAMLRPRWIAMLALAALVPFLFTDIPPLIDLPGHIGRFAVPAAPADSPIHRYFEFRWLFSLNMGTDLLVEGLRHLVGLFPAVWLVTALIPAITVCGIAAVARTLNPHGAFGLPWALLFVFNFSFLWGFVNFSLAAGLALLGFALWVRLEHRAGLRALLFLTAAPLLVVCHAVGGMLLPLMIASWEVSRRPIADWRTLPVAMAGRLWPLLGVGVPVLAWRLIGDSTSGAMRWIAARKVEAVLEVVRDQNVFLDIGTVAGALAVFVLGLFWGARPRDGSLGLVILMAILFFAAPSLIAGTDRIDTRLAPIMFMLALALQDWSTVSAGRRRWIMRAGIALLAVRMLATTLSFIAYDRSYDRELAALDHVAPGARVLNLSLVDCRLSGWRTQRLEHLSNLATPLRQAWVNSHWTVSGVHSLQIKYRPSETYYRDASHFIWPAACIHYFRPFAERERHDLVETLPTLPLDKVDYLWVIGDKIPAGTPDARLERIWASDISELYRIRRGPPAGVR